MGPISLLSQLFFTIGSVLFLITIIGITVFLFPIVPDQMPSQLLAGLFGFSVAGIPLLAFIVAPQVVTYWHFVTSVITSLYNVRRRRLVVFVVVVPVISFAARFAVAFPSSFVLPTTLSQKEEAVVELLREMEVVGHEFEKENRRFPEIGELESFSNELQESGNIWPESALGKAIHGVVRVQAGVFQGYQFSVERSRVHSFLHAVPLEASGASSYSFVSFRQACVTPASLPC